MTERTSTILVLAAGAGRRLGGMEPKPLVTIEGVPLLRKLLCQIGATLGEAIVAVTAGSGVAEAVWTWPEVGDLSGRIVEVPGPPTSDVQTVAATMDHWRGDLVLIDGDLVVATSLLSLLAQGSVSSVVVEAREAGSPIDMGVVSSNGRLVALGKHLPDEAMTAEFTGMSRIAAQDLEMFADRVHRRARTRDPGCYEDALTELASVSDVRVLRTPAAGMWMDIDTPADLHRARQVADSIRRA